MRKDPEEIHQLHIDYDFRTTSFNLCNVSTFLRVIFTFKALEIVYKIQDKYLIIPK